MLVKLAGLRGELQVPGVLGVDWDSGRKVKGLADEAKVKSQAGVSDAASTGKGSGAWLLMEWIEGESVKELLRRWDDWYKTATGDERREQEEAVKKLLRRIGRAVGAMHSRGGVVHGDLTTSNVMVRPFRSEEENVQFNGATEVASTASMSNGDRSSMTNSAQSSVVHAPSFEGELVLIDFGLAVQSIQDEDRAVDLYVLERAFGSTHPRQEGWFDAEVLQSIEGYRGSFKGSQVVLKRLEEVRMRGRKRTMIG